MKEDNEELGSIFDVLGTDAFELDEVSEKRLDKEAKVFAELVVRLDRTGELERNYGSEAHLDD